MGEGRGGRGRRERGKGDNGEGRCYLGKCRKLKAGQFIAAIYSSPLLPAGGGVYYYSLKLV